jgi:hypothetical protein
MGESTLDDHYASLDPNMLWLLKSAIALPQGGDATASMLLAPFRAGAAHIVFFGLIGSHINGDQHTQ